LPFLPATELIITILPRGPFSDGSDPSNGPNAWVAMIGPITLTSIWRRNWSADNSSTGPAIAMPALLTSPASVSPPSAARTSRAAASTAASSVTSNSSGIKWAPNSLVRRPASACLRTLPKTRNPRSSSSFAVAQPMPVDAPVMTTDRIFSPDLSAPWQAIRGDPEHRSLRRWRASRRG
jgi:hypothetical protein